MNLVPTEKSGVLRKLTDFTITIYGEPKIGKSDFCSNFPKALFVDLNSGLGGYDILKTPVITSWNQVLQVYAELKKEENKERYDWIIFDTLLDLYNLCLPAVTRRTTDCDHPADVNNGRGDYGKTWGEITKEMSNLMRSLAALGYGRILIAHVKEKETDFNTKVVTEFCKPNLGPGIGNTIASMSNIILYFRSERHKIGKPPNQTYEDFRVIRTLSSSNYLAGCQRVNGKVLPDPIPLEYAKFMKAFEWLIK